jgi:uncharacterized tellurite resistance protein B-like protein
MMTSTESLYYAIGELAYAIARADGNVQKEEQQRFHDLVAEHLNNKEYAFDVSDIIFQVMTKDKVDAETTYQWAMNQIKMNSHYLSPELKDTFIKVMEIVAKAYPPVTIEEQNLIDKFKKDIAPLKGDPVYYNNH